MSSDDANTKLLTSGTFYNAIIANIIFSVILILLLIYTSYKKYKNK